MVAVAGIYLFFPQYQLYEKNGSFSEDYHFRQSGFWSKKDCQREGGRLTNAYKCKTTNAWQGLLGKGHEYNKEKQY